MSLPLCEVAEILRSDLAHTLRLLAIHSFSTLSANKKATTVSTETEAQVFDPKTPSGSSSISIARRGFIRISKRDSTTPCENHARGLDSGGQGQRRQRILCR